MLYSNNNLVKVNAMDEELVVIGAGCFRTGTFSMKSALELLLNKPCYHYFELVKPEMQWQINLWNKAAESEAMSPEIAYQLFKGYKAIVDFPAAVFYEDLMKIYPNAKVVLTVRDSKKWALSASETVLASQKMVQTNFMYRMMYRILGYYHTVPLFTQLMQKHLGSNIENEDDNLDKLAEYFEQYNQKVIATVPNDRLLVFEVSQGWEPLCQFLDLPVPETPLPRVNDSAEFKDRIAKRQKTFKIGFTVIVTGAIVGTACVCLKYF